MLTRLARGWKLLLSAAVVGGVLGAVGPYFSLCSSQRTTRGYAAQEIMDESPAHALRRAGTTAAVGFTVGIVMVVRRRRDDVEE